MQKSIDFKSMLDNPRPSQSTGKRNTSTHADVMANCMAHADRELRNMARIFKAGALGDHADLVTACADKLAESWPNTPKALLNKEN